MTSEEKIKQLCKRGNAYLVVGGKLDEEVFRSILRDAMEWERAQCAYLIETTAAEKLAKLCSGLIRSHRG